MNNQVTKKPKKMGKKAIAAATSLYYKLWGWTEGCLDKKEDNIIEESLASEWETLSPTEGQLNLLDFYSSLEKHWFEKWIAALDSKDDKEYYAQFRKYKELSVNLKNLLHSKSEIQ